MTSQAATFRLQTNTAATREPVTKDLRALAEASLAGKADFEARRRILETIREGSEADVLEALKVLSNAEQRDDLWLPDGAMAVVWRTGLPGGRDEVPKETPDIAVAVSAEIWESLAKRAARDAKREGAMLTPLLVPLINDAFWAAKRFDSADHTTVGGSQIKEKDVLDALIHKSAIGEALSKIINWVDATTHADELSWVHGLDDEYWQLTDVVLERTPAVKNGKDVATLAQTKRLGAIARNPNLTSDGQKALLDVFVANIGAPAGGVSDFLEEVRQRKWRLDATQLLRLKEAVILIDEAGSPEKDANWGYTLARVASIPQALEVERITEVLEHVRAASVQLGLLRYASGQLWLRTLNKVLSHEPRLNWVDQVLAEVTESQLEGLSEHDIKKLIRDTNGHVRTQGLRFIVALKAKQKVTR